MLLALQMGGAGGCEPRRAGAAGSQKGPGERVLPRDSGGAHSPASPWLWGPETLSLCRTGSAVGGELLQQ